MDASVALNKPRHDIAYLVMSHGKPAQALRLARTLRGGSPDAAIFMHHDAKAPAPEPSELRSIRITLVAPRIAVDWGTFSLVEAVLAGVAAALAAVDFRWLIVLSGQDYPVRATRLIEHDLLTRPNDAFVLASPVDAGNYPHRYHLRYWALPRFRYAHRLPGWLARGWAHTRAVINAHNRLIRIHPQPRRLPTLLGLRPLRSPFSDAFVCYKGSQWMNLSHRAAEYLVNFGSERPDVIDYYRRTLIPDESYFQTVLINARHLRISADSRRYIRWDLDQWASPRTLTMEHLAAIIESGADFARKFDINVDSQILDALDEIVLGSQGVEGRQDQAADVSRPAS